MNLPRRFDEYVEEGIVRRQRKDASRAKFLFNEAEMAKKALAEIIDKVGVSDINANLVVKSSYDIIMELIRAIMLFEGFNSSGKGAHEAEVAFLRKLNFSDIDVKPVNELRYFRNAVTYYGRVMDREYAEKVVVLLKKIYPVLRNFEKNYK